MIEALWLALPVLALLGFQAGRRRALGLVHGGAVELHSLPTHYGQLVLIWASLPPLVLLVLWALFGNDLVEGWAMARVEASGVLAAEQDARSVLMDVRSGLVGLGQDGRSPAHVSMEGALARSREILGWSLAALVAGVSGAGISFARGRVAPDLRARNQVEMALRMAL
ncbi:MAG: phosphate ABC transporter permease family protein, partial [Deltaproteobacteria bacterium]|nr:phosphate ABC transporter permease family protein [Deltaproteobacteria bacterium]